MSFFDCLASTASTSPEVLAPPRKDSPSVLASTAASDSPEVLAAVAADARPKPNTKPDTLFKGPGVTILDRQGVQAIRSNKSQTAGWVVAFYAPWCGHCRHYAPEFKKFGAALQGQYPNIKAGAVSCTAERKACDENSVKGYPTVKSFGALGHDIVLKRHQSKDLLELVRSKQTDAAFQQLLKPSC